MNKTAMLIERETKSCKDICHEIIKHFQNINSFWISSLYPKQPPVSIAATATNMTTSSVNNDDYYKHNNPLVIPTFILFRVVMCWSLSRLALSQLTSQSQ